MYFDLLKSRYSSLEPNQLTEELARRSCNHIPLRVIVNHLMYMCEQAQVFIKEDRIEKAMRWLGFLQGVLWFATREGSFVNIEVTLEDLKHHSMPDPQT
jgi:hypothetical protein